MFNNVYKCFLRLLGRGFGEIIAFQNALKTCVTTNSIEYAKKYEDFHIGFEGR